MVSGDGDGEGGGGRVRVRAASAAWRHGRAGEDLVHGMAHAGEGGVVDAGDGRRLGGMYYLHPDARVVDDSHVARLDRVRVRVRVRVRARVRVRIRVRIRVRGLGLGLGLGSLVTRLDGDDRVARVEAVVDDGGGGLRQYVGLSPCTEDGERG